MNQSPPPLPSLIKANECESLTIGEVRNLYRRYINPGQVELLGSFGFGHELVVKAEGCRLQTDRGRTILDFTGGMGVLNHGHNHPRLLAARHRFQQQNRMEVHKNYLSPWMAALGHNIATLLPDDLCISYFPNSGAEAVEGAVKMAWKAHDGRRKQILHSDIAYHGKLLGTLSLSGSSELDYPFPRIPGCHPFRYGDIDSVETLIERLRRPDGESDIYALIVEPFSASTLHSLDGETLRRLRQLCDREQIALIFDEVFSGWHKTGELFYFMEHAVVPDLLVTSKSIGGGKSSIACFVAREPLFRRAYGSLSDSLMHSTTYNGFGEECLTALEAIQIMVDDNYRERALTIGQQLADGLHALQQRHPDKIAEVRGQGALQGIITTAAPAVIEGLARHIPVGLLQDPAFSAKLISASIIHHLYEQHAILTYHAENRQILLMAAPSLVVSEAETEQFLAALDETLDTGWLKLCARFVASRLFRPFMERFELSRKQPGACKTQDESTAETGSRQA